MSPRSSRLRIEDILDAISDIEKFINGFSQEDFETDKKTYLAVIRSLEVIGEASHNFSDELKSKYKKIPWRKMKDFRNVLIHEYFGVDPEIVWKTIHDDLIPLKSDFKEILKIEF